MPNLVYSYPDFVPFTKILSSEVNAKFNDIKTLLNVTGLTTSNIQQYGVARDRLAAGTADHVVINAPTTGYISSEAQLATTRGGLGFSPAVNVGNAGKVVRVKDDGTGFELGSSDASVIIEPLNNFVPSIVAGEAITALDAVAVILNEGSYKIVKADSDAGGRNTSTLGIALASASVTPQIVQIDRGGTAWTTGTVTITVNGIAYAQAYAVSNDNSMTLLAAQIATNNDVQSASVVDAGSDDRLINITSKGGLTITVSSGASGGAPTFSVTTTQAAAGDNVRIHVFGPLDGFSGLTLGNSYYTSTTAGALVNSTSEGGVFIGQAISSTVLFVNTQLLQFIFPSAALFVKTHGHSASSAATATATVEHFNFSSWSSGTADSASRTWGPIGEAILNSLYYYIDGQTSGGSSTARTASYNKTSWTVETAKTTGRALCGTATLSGQLLVGKGAVDASATGQDSLDAYNGSSWSNVLASFAQAAVSAGSFIQGGLAYWCGGYQTSSGRDNVDTFNGTATSTSTAMPVSKYWSACARASGSTGIVGGQDGGSTDSYSWNGASWSSAITMTYAAQENTSGASASGPASGYNISSALMYVNGGQASSAGLTTSAKFNGASWSSATSSSSGRGAPSGSIY